MRVNPISNNNVSHKSKLKVTPELTAYLKNAKPEDIKSFKESYKKLLNDGKNKIYEYKNEIVDISAYGKKYKARFAYISDETQELYGYAYVSNAHEASACKNDNEIETNYRKVGCFLNVLFNHEKYPEAYQVVLGILRIPRPYSLADFKKEPFIPNL